MKKNLKRCLTDKNNKIMSLKKIVKKINRRIDQL